MNRSFCLIMCSSLLLVSCTKNNSDNLPSVTCSSFDDPLFIEWFPYVTSQRMIFKNDSGAADTITIGSVDISGTITKKSATFTKDSCYATAIIFSTGLVDSNVLKLYVEDVSGSSGRMDSVEFNLYGFSFTTNPVSDTGLNLQAVNPRIYSSTYSNYNFYGKTYNKVQIITTTDTIVKNTHIPWIDKVFISQNVGIIGYETFPQKQRWVLQ